MMLDLSALDDYFTGIFHSPLLLALKPLSLFITQLGSPYLWLVISSLALVAGDSKVKKLSVILIIALFFSIVITNDIKNMVERGQPEGAENSLLIFSNGYSFPSGHAVTAFIVAVVLGSYAKRWQQATLYGMAVLVSLSRLALGVHYFSDVLAGALLGIFFGEFVQLAAHRAGISDKAGVFSGARLVSSLKAAWKPLLSKLRMVWRGDGGGAVYVLLAAGVILVLAASILELYSLTLGIIAILSMAVLAMESGYFGKHEALLLNCIAIISVGLLSSMGAAFLQDDLLSILIALATYIALLLLPAKKEYDEAKSSISNSS